MRSLAAEFGIDAARGRGGESDCKGGGGREKRERSSKWRARSSKECLKGVSAAGLSAGRAFTTGCCEVVALDQRPTWEATEKPAAQYLPLGLIAFERFGGLR